MVFGRIVLSHRQRSLSIKAQQPISRRVSAMALASVLATSLFLTACGSAPVAPGFYRVQRGDTLTEIARKQGQSASALARWNNLTDPNQINVDQVLRVAPPAGSGDLRTEPASSGSTTANTSNTRKSPAQTNAMTPRAVRRTGPAAVPALPTGGPPASRTITLAWPAAGAVITRFDGSRNKGLDIAANLGDPVIAAASGEIAYVGQLRGYGNLLIIKHSNGFLTSYAHLQGFDVREGQSIAAGKQVATVGATESPRPMLHFELRYNGQPVDPARYLPPR